MNTVPRLLHLVSSIAMVFVLMVFVSLTGSVALGVEKRVKIKICTDENTWLPFTFKNIVF